MQGESLGAVESLKSCMALSRRCCEKDELRQFEVDVQGSRVSAIGFREGEVDKPMRKEVSPNLNESTLGATDHEYDAMLSIGNPTKSLRISMAEQSSKQISQRFTNKKDNFASLADNMEIQSQLFNDRH